MLTENSDYINKIYTVGSIGSDTQGVSYDYQYHFYPLRQDVRDVINKFIKDADEGFKQDILACLGVKMTARSKKRHKSGNYKKMPNQTHAYNSFIANSTYSPDATMPDANKMLSGTAEISGRNEDQIDSVDPIKKTPFKYRFLDWVKEHIFPTIMTTVVVAIGSVLISHKVQIAVIDQRIVYLDKQIEMISSETVDKELLELQLEALKKEVDSSSSLALNDIKWQIKILEEKIYLVQQAEDNE